MRLSTKVIYEIHKKVDFFLEVQPTVSTTEVIYKFREKSFAPSFVCQELIQKMINHFLKKVLDRILANVTANIHRIKRKTQNLHRRLKATGRSNLRNYYVI